MLKMAEPQATIFAAAMFVAFMIVVMLVVRTRGTATYGRLAQIARSFGWENPQRVWMGAALRAQWRGYNVELHHMHRYKSNPERLQLTVFVDSPGRLIVKRRSGGVFSKPMTVFGPPIVDVHSFAQHEDFWIRADDGMQIESLFSRKEFTKELDTNLIALFDTLDLEATKLCVSRALDDGVVKKKFTRPTFQWSRDLEFIERIAREEWPLAVAAIDALALRSAR
jgi:hypothetical protein